MLEFKHKTINLLILEDLHCTYVGLHRDTVYRKETKGLMCNGFSWGSLWPSTRVIPWNMKKMVLQIIE